MKTNTLSTVMIALLAGSTLQAVAASPTGSQCALRLNEILINPKGGDDQLWEFIEIRGEGDTSLSGLAVVFVNDDGGVEVDESFIFPESDQYRTNSDGYFVLWNSGVNNATEDVTASASSIWGVLPTSITQNFNPANADFADAILFGTTRHEASFKILGTMGSGGASDYPGKIANSGSLSILLLSDWTTNAAISKDAVVTDSVTAGTPDFTTASGIIDAVAYSDNGAEFVGLEGREIDYTPGFKPDALTRVDDVEPETVFADRYMAGAEEFRDAYTNWVFGDIEDNADFAYKGNKALGGVDRPAASGTATQPTVNIEMTPGTMNESFNGRGGSSVTPSSCTSFIMTPDQDGNGVVNYLDLIHASREGNTQAVRSILKTMAQ